MTILRLGSHPQTISRLECRADGGLHPLARYQVEAEALEEHCQDRLEFHHGKRGTDATTRSSTKGDECVGSMRFATGRIEALGSKDLWLGELFRHTMTDIGRVHDDVACCETVPFPLKGFAHNA